MLCSCIIMAVVYKCDIICYLAPPSITELMYDGFTCDVSLEVFPLDISWTVSMIIHASVILL